ncbi:hypothetical protein COC42_16565 [Sphingomonas spermidinifaciens]|uniref:RHS repeat protein n=1 Tax=Sphingomonas spermidinifaciens TaxID=1141889 RepID=A0A2A4B212_9SPHN|nr:RHS repeat protein [Sphingomonas spermidinifaciens]PCD01724.1 hypothetical protein COC42_16565 [Sphingomonas spermidinifaciens]
MSVGQKAASAAGFLAHVGVNIHSGPGLDGYANSSMVLRSLNYLGIDRVRDAFAVNGVGGATVTALADAGIKFDFIYSRERALEGNEGFDRFVTELTKFRADHPGGLLAVEGLNEVNLSEIKHLDVSGLDAAAVVQRGLYAAIKGSAALSDIPVINLTVGNEDKATYQALGDLGAYSDFANSHAYTPTGASGDRQMEESIALAKTGSSGDPVWITETGFTTLPSAVALGVTDAVQAKLTLTSVFHAFENGAAQTFLYELLDSNLDNGRPEREQHFGLFEADGTPKLAATALHNLNAIFSDTRTAAGDRSAVMDETAFSLTGAPKDTHSMTLSKGEGVFDIAVWRDAVLWDGKAKKEIEIAPATMTLDFGSVQKTVYVYDPLKGLDPVAVYHDVDRISLSVGDSPLIVEVGAGAAVAKISHDFDAEVAMTASQFVASIDKLAQSPDLSRVTLTDGQALRVSSKAAIVDMIANYGDVLGKIAGGYSFVTTVLGDDWREDKQYDSTGALVTTIDSGFSKGVLVSQHVIGADGSDQKLRYVGGKLVEDITVSAAGDRTVKRYDAATGDLQWVTEDNADGTRRSSAYEGGLLKSLTVIEKSGRKIVEQYEGTRLAMRDVYEPSGDSSHSVIDEAGQLSRRTINYADGRVEQVAYGLTGRGYAEQHQYFDAKGKVTAVTRYRGDGTMHSTENYAADGGKAFATYNAAGKLATTARTAADGTRDTRSFAANGATVSWSQVAANGVTTNKTYDPETGALRQQTVQRPDGSSEINVFGISGRSYTRQTSVLDSAGRTVSLTRYHADGTLDYTENNNYQSGARAMTMYDAAGRKTSTARIESNGARETLTYDTAGRIVARTTVDENGVTTITRYSYDGSMLSRLVNNPDGTGESHLFNVTNQPYSKSSTYLDKNGKTVALVQYRADGTLYFTLNRGSNAVAESNYDARGRLVTSLRTMADGSRTTLTYAPETGKLLSKQEVTATSDFITSRYEGGVLSSITSRFADGNWSVETFANGGSTLESYTAKGARISTRVTDATGTQTLTTYDPLTGKPVETKVTSAALALTPSSGQNSAASALLATTTASTPIALMDAARFGVNAAAVTDFSVASSSSSGLGLGITTIASRSNDRLQTTASIGL